MMGLVLRLLGGSSGPFIAGAVAAAVLALSLGLGVQSARLAHAKHDLTNARAALVNPDTRRTWQSEAKQAAADLGQCHINAGKLAAAIDVQSASIDLLKTQGEERTAAAAKALQVAQGAVQAASKASAAVMASKPSEDRCASALAVLKGAAG